METKTRTRRLNRVRRSVKRAANGRARLSVHRSGKHIYAQVIDGDQTLAHASSADARKDGGMDKTWNLDAATQVGRMIAQRALEKGVKQVVFDRGGYLYHGRVKALAEAAREGGLEF